jgi:hypothetical protein
MLATKNRPAGGRQGDWVAQVDAGWLRLGAEWNAPDWLRTTILPARETLLFLGVWVEERTLLPRQEALRAIDGARGLVGALMALTREEREDWMDYRTRLAWRLAKRFEPAKEAVDLYRSWGFAF